MAWNKRIDSFLVEACFTKYVLEHGVYVNNASRLTRVIIYMYVYNLLITDADEAKMKGSSRRLMQDFEMSDLGNLSYFLGMNFKDTNRGVFLQQKKYAQDILKRFKMGIYNTVLTPLETGEKL